MVAGNRPSRSATRISRASPDGSSSVFSRLLAALLVMASAGSMTATLPPPRIAGEAKISHQRPDLLDTDSVLVLERRYPAQISVFRHRQRILWQRSTDSKPRCCRASQAAAARLPVPAPRKSSGHVPRDPAPCLIRSPVRHYSATEYPLFYNHLRSLLILTLI